MNPLHLDILFGREIIDLPNKFNIDTLEIMIALLPVINIEEDKIDKINEELDKFILFIQHKIKRNITAQENLLMLQGIMDCVKSEPATDERV